MRSNSRPKGATTFKETAFGIISRKRLLSLEIEGTKKGLELVRDNHSQRLDSAYILNLHRISFVWIFPDWAGKYRQIQVEYSGKEAPKYDLVPELIQNLCDDLSTRIRFLPPQKSDIYGGEIVKLLAWFQHQFVVIHPFQDYNGRLARMLTIFLLLYLKIPPLEIRASTSRDRSMYLRAMQSADLGDYSRLEKLISTAILETLEKHS